MSVIAVKSYLILLQLPNLPQLLQLPAKKPNWTVTRPSIAEKQGLPQLLALEDRDRLTWYIPVLNLPYIAAITEFTPITAITSQETHIRPLLD